MIDSNGVLGIFLGSFAAMVKVFLTCLVGVLCAVYPRGDPLLPDVALRLFSRLVTLVLVAPLTTFALGSTLTPALLAEYSILIPFCLANVLFSFLLFNLLKPLHQKDPALIRASMVATTSPNIIAMPLMMLKGLCELDLIKEDYSGDSDACFNEATSMLFVYSIGFNLLFWAVQYPILIDTADAINGVPQEAESPTEGAIASRVHRARRMLNKTKLLLGRVATTPAMIGIYLGLFIGLVPGLSGMVFGEKLTVLTPLGGTIQVLSTPVVCLNTLIMAASLAKVRLPPSVVERYFWWVVVIVRMFDKKAQPTMRKIVSRESIASNEAHTETSKPSRNVIGLVRTQSRRLRERVLSRMGQRRTRSLTWTDMDPSAVVSGVEFVQMDERGCVIGPVDGDDVDEDARSDISDSPFNCSETGGEEEMRTTGLTEDTGAGAREKNKERGVVTVTPGTFLVHVLSRLILPPIATIVLLRLSVMVGVVAASARMTQLVIVLQSANPSAQMVIVCLNQLGVPDLAAQISLLYVGQYLLCIVTLTLWASVGMAMIYPQD